VSVSSIKIEPAEQLKKFQGDNPIKTEIINLTPSIFKWGKLKFISQLGVPGKTLRKIM
jgi:hypothetical protein